MVRRWRDRLRRLDRLILVGVVLVIVRRQIVHHHSMACVSLQQAANSNSPRDCGVLHRKFGNSFVAFSEVSEFLGGPPIYAAGRIQPTGARRFIRPARSMWLVIHPTCRGQGSRGFRCAFRARPDRPVVSPARPILRRRVLDAAVWRL